MTSAYPGEAGGRTRTWSSFVLLPTVLIAVAVLAYFTFRTTMQLEKLRQQSVLEATLALASEKADRLDHRLIEEDDALVALADPTSPADLAERWLPAAQRQTPTIRAVLLLDSQRRVLAFASRAGGAWSDEEAFRRLLVQRMWPDMELSAQPADELRHLHRAYGGQSYLVSYWQRALQGRRYVLVAWHDIGRVVRDVLPTLDADMPGTPAARRVNVIDEEGRVVFGPPLLRSEFTVAVRFPTTLYGWRVQVSPTASDELAARVQNRRLLEMVMVSLSSAVIVAGVVTILLAAEKDRRVSALKSEFVANVSHELKTPLALVRMFGEMLQSGRVASEEKRKQYLDIIVGESERLSALIENVLDFARVERGRQAYELAPGDVGDSVSRAVAVYRYRAEREGTDVVLEIEPALPAVHIDDRAVQLAVINLLDNALKYAAGTPTVTVRCAREGDAVAVRVTDLGPGIPAEDRGRIFERFVRGPRPGPVRGSGIGLSLVKHIAESHGGRAWVESEVGRGSTFVFTVPVGEKALLTADARAIS